MSEQRIRVKVTPRHQHIPRQRIPVRAKLRHHEESPIAEYKAKRYIFSEGEFTSGLRTTFLVYRKGEIHQYRLSTDSKLYDLTDLQLHTSGCAFVRATRLGTQLIRLNAENIERVSALKVADQGAVDLNYEDLREMVQRIDNAQY